LNNRQPLNWQSSVGRWTLSREIRSRGNPEPRRRRQASDLPRQIRAASVRSQIVDRQQRQKAANKMDKDRIIGVGKQIIGSAKEVVGKLVGDAKLQTDGKAEQVEGKLQNAIGSAKDTLK
jgi:uncharacterized protein YjbJ (UPF0337 family)